MERGLPDDLDVNPPLCTAPIDLRDIVQDDDIPIGGMKFLDEPLERISIVVMMHEA